MKDKLHIARGLSRADRLLLLEAWWILLAYYFLLRTVDFDRLNQSGGLKSMSCSTDRLDYAPRVHRIVYLASRLHLLSMTCLVRALCLRRMLNRRGVPAEIRIGVTRSLQGIHAHAWLVVNGEQVGEPEDVTERFRTLDLTKLGV